MMQLLHAHPHEVFIVKVDLLIIQTVLVYKNMHPLHILSQPHNLILHLLASLLLFR